MNLPKKLQEKIKEKAALYHQGGASAEDERKIVAKEYYPENMGIMKPFEGNHPAVMQGRVARFPIRYRLRSRWLNPEFYAYVLRHGFKG